MEDEAVTMVDVLEQQRSAERLALAVLGASDAGACTWSSGSGAGGRQALYSCVTCQGPAALCLACSLACHERHELLELYTKRGFRCDCGTPRLGGAACRLASAPRPRNTDNRYNHNFAGRYCTCRRPYPDPEAEGAEDAMLQCCVCEDWLHAGHLGAPLPEPDAYEELVCAACSDRLPFLDHYRALSVRADDADPSVASVDDSLLDTTVETKEPSDDEPTKSNPDDEIDTKPDVDLTPDDLPTNSNDVDVKTDEASSNKTEDDAAPAAVDKIEPESAIDDSSKTSTDAAPETTDSRAESADKIEEPTDVPNEPVEPTVETPAPDREEAENLPTEKRKIEGGPELEAPAKRAKLTDEDDVVECTKPAASLEKREGATFWPSNWRTKLCVCPACLRLYEELEVSFLTNPADTVAAYESLGKADPASAESQYEKGLEALSSLDRIQQINAITEYNKMKEKLVEFLKTFKDKREVVKEEDIKDFFAGMKPKREPDGVYFCR